MNKVLLVDPVSLAGLSFEGSNIRPPAPNMRLAHLGTHLQAHGVETRIVDMRLPEQRDIRAHLWDFCPDIVGITAMTFNVLGAYRVAEIVAEESPATVVLGGVHASVLPERTLRECKAIDCIVVGPGENALLSLVQKNQVGAAQRVITGEAVDVNSAPFADYSLVDISEYGMANSAGLGMKAHRYPIFHSRGCPFNCAFCCSERKWEPRLNELVIHELQRMHRDRGARFIFFEDPTFLPNPEVFEDFCALYRAAGLDRVVDWGFATRCDIGNRRMFEQAKRAGCSYVFLGVESGSEKVLAAVNKRYTRQQIRECVKAAKDAGIQQVRGSFIIGLPYETRATVEATLTLIEELPLDGAGVSLLDCYPGTAVYDMANKGEGGLRWIEGRKDDWESYSRARVQTEVNDLDEQALLALHQRAKVIAQGKARRPRRRVADLARKVLR